MSKPTALLAALLGIPLATGTLSAPATMTAAAGTGAKPMPAIAPSAEPQSRRPLLKPNARALPANRLYIARGGSGQRVLWFESGLANVGAGVLEVRPDQAGNCKRNQQHASQILFRDRDRNGRYNRKIDRFYERRDAGCMVFHPRHDHWHFEAAARYALWDPDRRREPVVVKRRKMSFCLRDIERAPERWSTPNYAARYGDCHRHTPQGISIGWVDIYGNYLPGQSLVLPGKLRAEVYCVRTTVDPENELRESNDGDNHSLRAVRISGDRVTVKPTRRCRSIA